MQVFNTLSGKKEDFKPQGDEVKMYVCGVTPYDEAHLGHAMSYIIFDVIRRYLNYRGYKVKYVQNVTDIDDKIIDRANKLGVPPRELAEEFTRSFFDDMAALNIGKPDVTPRATEEIPKIIEIVLGLIDKGYAYEARGSVYFRVKKVPDYGKLSHRSLESMRSGTRIEPGEEKEDPMDFVLWKASKPGEPAWDSPWGKGRPGWHIECSAMSLKYLGNTLDIHGGGQDLVFPHHENEIAQSESFTGVKPFVRYWLHNGMVQLGEEKMSKSLGNLITIKEALKNYSADAIRIFVLSSHYRRPLTYSEEILEAAERGAERLRQAVNNPSSSGKADEKIDTESYRQRFIQAMDDDFNTAQAVAALFDLAREINRGESEGASADKARELLKELGGVLGLSFKGREEPVTIDFIESLSRSNEEIVTAVRAASERDQKIADEVSDQLEKIITTQKQCQDFLLHQDKDIQVINDAVQANIAANISLRDYFRKNKQWQLADMIRAKLEEAGIVLEDTPQGTVWRRKR